MIEGLHFDVTSGQLMQHLRERMEYHRERQAVYDREISRLEKVDLERESDQDIHLTRVDGPKENLKRRSEEHRAKAQKFELLLNHVILGEVYRLSDEDLIKLEFIDQSSRW